MNDKHVVVIGAGITGLAAALRILSEPHPPRVTIFESLNRIGGVINASSFAGIASLDESADAFLTRTPSAMDLVKQVGLSDALTSPATGDELLSGVSAPQLRSVASSCWSRFVWAST